MSRQKEVLYLACLFEIKEPQSYVYKAHIPDFCYLPGWQTVPTDVWRGGGRVQENHRELRREQG